MPSSTITTNVGGRIRSFRKTADLRQIDLAQRVGVAREHIARVELGACNPSLILLVQIADALDIRLTDLTSDLRLIPAVTRP